MDRNQILLPLGKLKPTANMRFAARLARRCCNRQQIFNQQRPQGDLFKLSSE